MLNYAAMLLAGVDFISQGPGPDGPPTSVVKAPTPLDPPDVLPEQVSLSWTVGDSAAETQIAHTEDGSEPTDSTPIWTTLSPTTASFDTGAEWIEFGPTPNGWWVRHRKNGRVTVWVEAQE